jgi:hypothetical protein
VTLVSAWTVVIPRHIPATTAMTGLIMDCMVFSFGLGILIDYLVFSGYERINALFNDV